MEYHVNMFDRALAKETNEESKTNLIRTIGAIQHMDDRQEVYTALIRYIKGCMPIRHLVDKENFVDMVNYICEFLEDDFSPGLARAYFSISIASILDEY
jgi:hypothetical protein